MIDVSFPIGKLTSIINNIYCLIGTCACLIPFASIFVFALLLLPPLLLRLLLLLLLLLPLLLPLPLQALTRRRICAIARIPRNAPSMRRSTRNRQHRQRLK